MKDSGSCGCFWELGERIDDFWWREQPWGDFWEDWINGVEFEVAGRMALEVSEEVLMNWEEWGGSKM